jgi:hypothetical protein
MNTNPEDVKDLPLSEKPQPATQDDSGKVLPYSKWWPLLIGVFVGILLRFFFSDHAGGWRSAMARHFIYGAPLAVSAVTVYLAERARRRTWRYYFWMGAMANALFVLGTLVILIEGLICAIIIVPLFMLLGGIGGLIMGAICRWMIFPRTSVLSFVTLPVVLALVVPQTENIPYIGTIERSVVIQTTREKVWPHLMNADHIRSDEVGHGWLYRIGVPLPSAGLTARDAASNELVRAVTMGKNIHFEQRASQWRDNQFVRWTYRFTPDSFPPQALDDHVQIGGAYFDIIDTRYTLLPLAENTTRLDIQMHYRVSTDFNWYANGVAKLLIGNFAEVILDFYRVRAERAAVPASRKSM